MSITLSVIAWLAGTQVSPLEILNVALHDAEPPPSMRAAFRARISSASAERLIEYDPLQPRGKRFRLAKKVGEDAELDTIVLNWGKEAQPDVRLFADDLRSSLGQGRMLQTPQGWQVQFQHKLSSNDGPVDAALSQRMEGSLTLDTQSGLLSKLEYQVNSAFKTSDGLTVDSYRQIYSFGRSQQWGLTFVTGYDLHATGGRFGLRKERTYSVRITDVAFTLAGDANQELVSR
jgi:hypothetical protein